MSERVSFEEFELDPTALELFRAGEPLSLQPQPVRVLAALARRPGELVTHEELRRELWGDETHVQFVGSLHSCIKQLRAALGDDASAPRFIETLPRRGYRFLPKVRPKVVEPGPRRRAWLAAIAAAAAVALLLARPDSRGPAAARSAEAHDALLKGAYLLEKRAGASLEDAERYFREALAREADLAEAHEGLAEIYLRRALDSGEARGYEAALAAADRALALAPSAKAHFLRAMALWYGRWDWEGAGDAFERALAASPELARAHHWYAYYLSGLGRHADALREIERARELDPLSPPIQADVGWFYFFAGRYQEALAASRRTLELEPGFVLAEDCIVESYLALGEPGEALREASSFEGRHYDELDALWRSRLDSGRGPYDSGLAALRLGQEELALERLRVAASRRSLWLPVLGVDPRWSALRSRPELVELLRAVGPSRGG